MNKELIINATPTGVEIALLENKKLVELHYDQTSTGFAVGDLYLGKVHKLMPGMNAAFVNVGFEKDGFLHYTDLSPYAKSLLKFTTFCVQLPSSSPLPDFDKFSIEPEIVKTGKINEVLAGKPNILVQILKEPISSKGPRLSCEISLPGRFIVITPFNNIVAVSKKIHSSEERRRLQKIVEAIKPKNFGVIVRTAAEGKNTAELHEDVQSLVSKWGTIMHNMQGAKPPTKVLSEQDKTTSILRDLLNEDFNRIAVNDRNIFNDVRSYIQKIAPEKIEIVSFHNGSSLFDISGVTKQVKAAFGKTVTLSSGAYLVIEPTEALHVIDVNSGYKNTNTNQEENSLQTNLEAAEEIARQLRLRDLGGIIVVDFIDMKLPENRKKLFESMERFMKNDRARHSILPISKFGLLQITRQRMKPEMKIRTEEICPSCEGTGKISSSLVLEDEIAKNINYLITHGHKKLTVTVHPILEAFLKQGFFSRQMQWMWKYKKIIRVKSNNNYQLTEYRFFDSNGEEIKL